MVSDAFRKKFAKGTAELEKTQARHQARLKKSGRKSALKRRETNVAAEDAARVANAKAVRERAAKAQEAARERDKIPIKVERHEKAEVSKISPLAMAGEAITGKGKEGGELSTLERIKQGTGAIRNIAIGVLAGSVIGIGAGNFALNSKIAIQSAIKNRGVPLYKTALEARYPYGGAAKLKWADIGNKVWLNADWQAKYGGLFRYAANTKNIGIVGTKMSESLTAKTLKTMMKLGIGVGVLGGITYASFWGKAETPEPLAIVQREVTKQYQFSGSEEDKALMLETNEATEDYYSTIANPDKMSWVPFVGATKNAIAKGKAGLKASQLLNKLGENIITSRETNVSLEQAERDDFDRRAKERVDYFNAEAIATEEAKIALREEAAKTKEAREKKILLETVALWEQHQKDMVKLKEEASIRAVEEWKDYLKLKFEMQRDYLKLKEEQKPSQLGFGLLG